MGTVMTKPWRRHPVIYEINTAVWLCELTRKYGFSITLSNIPDPEWDALALLQVDAIWLMGVWGRSPEGIAVSNANAGNLADFRRALPDFSLSDNLGSPYCIRRYEVDPRFGGNAALTIARKQLASRKIQLILDFVPNHMARDHEWVTEHPDYFIRGDENDLQSDPVTFTKIDGNVFACGKDPYYPAWQDVLQINVFHPELRRAILQTLSQLASQCDGVRCDMAMLVMNKIFQKTWGSRAGKVPQEDYWETIIPVIKSTNPRFIFIAEAYWDLEWELQQQGFDFCYDKRLYDRLESTDPFLIKQHLSADIVYQEKLLRFIENHDEPRAASLFGKKQERLMAVISSTLPGARLFHDGQPEGRKTKLPVFLQRRIDESCDQELFLFYHKLLDIISLPVFHEGSWQRFEATGWDDNLTYRNLLCWGWSMEGTMYLVIGNMSAGRSSGRIRPEWKNLEGSRWRLTDPLNETSFDRDGNEMLQPGLFVSLDGWEFHFFRFILS